MKKEKQIHQDFDKNNQTDFGYQRVNEQEKTESVRSVFKRVAKKYDLMNDLMSGGLHKKWKARLIEVMDLLPEMKILDMAGGTGDITFKCVEYLAGQGTFTTCDINEAMLKVGQERAIDKGILTPINWTVTPAETLPFPDNFFDRYTISFGLRNVTDKTKALQEAYRVLKPGGQFTCLEFSEVKQPVLQKLYDLYSFEIIPKMGEMVLGDKDSYQYLVESIRQFPNQEVLKNTLEEIGFQNTRFENFMGGVTALHQGWK